MSKYFGSFGLKTIYPYYARSLKTKILYAENLAVIS